MYVCCLFIFLPNGISSWKRKIERKKIKRREKKIITDSICGCWHFAQFDLTYTIRYSQASRRVGKQAGIQQKSAEKIESLKTKPKRKKCWTTMFLILKRRWKAKPRSTTEQRRTFLRSKKKKNKMCMQYMCNGREKILNMHNTKQKAVLL